MTAWATAFLIAALVAATLGFGGVPGLAASIARMIFVVMLTAAAVTGCIAWWRIRRQRRGESIAAGHAQAAQEEGTQSGPEE